MISKPNDEAYIARDIGWQEYFCSLYNNVYSQHINVLGKDAEGSQKGLCKGLPQKYLRLNKRIKMLSSAQCKSLMSKLLFMPVILNAHILNVIVV